MLFVIFTPFFILFFGRRVALKPFKSRGVWITVIAVVVTMAGVAVSGIETPGRRKSAGAFPRIQ